MKLLLDTHALLWFALNDARLSSAAASAIVDPALEKYVSPASYWEIAIKIGLGKYALTVPYDTFMATAIGGNGFRVLPIELAHTSLLTSMPHHHRDPFDRLIIAQAISESMTVVGSDPKFDSYGVTRIW